MYAPNQLHSSVVYNWISNLLDDQFYKWINYIEKKNLSRKSDKKSCWFWLFILLCKMVSSHIYTLLYIATCLSSSHIKHGSFDRKNFLKIHFNFSILFQNVNDIVAIRCTRICCNMNRPHTFACAQNFNIYVFFLPDAFFIQFNSTNNKLDRILSNWQKGFPVCMHQIEIFEYDLEFEINSFELYHWVLKAIYLNHSLFLPGIHQIN